MDAYEQKIYLKCTSTMKRVWLKCGRRTNNRTERRLDFALREVLSKFLQDGTITDFNTWIDGNGFPMFDFEVNRESLRASEEKASPR